MRRTASILTAQTLTNVAGVASAGRSSGLTSAERRAAAERGDIRVLRRRPPRLQPRAAACSAVARRKAERRRAWFERSWSGARRCLRRRRCA